MALAAHSHAWLACKVKYRSTDCTGIVDTDPQCDETGCECFDVNSGCTFLDRQSNTRCVDRPSCWGKYTSPSATCVENAAVMFILGQDDESMCTDATNLGPFGTPIGQCQQVSSYSYSYTTVCVTDVSSIDATCSGVPTPSEPPSRRRRQCHQRFGDGCASRRGREPVFLNASSSCRQVLLGWGIPVNARRSARVGEVWLSGSFEVIHTLPRIA